MDKTSVLTGTKSFWRSRKTTSSRDWLIIHNLQHIPPFPYLLAIISTTSATCSCLKNKLQLVDHQQMKHHINTLCLLHMPSTSRDKISVLSLDYLCFQIKSIAYQGALQFLNKKKHIQGNEMREVALTLVGSRTQWLHTCKSLFWKLYIIVQEGKLC